MNPRPRPVTLIILDGFGYREETKANAIAAAHKPNWDQIWSTCPHTLLSGSGRCVGLPDGQMGNSEVGHLNMGAGRIVNQDLSRIDIAIESGDFYHNKTLLDAIEKAKTTHKSIHVIGLLSPGGVHSHERHIEAFVKLAAQQKISSLYIHAFLDGRDTPPQSALSSLESLESYCHAVHCGEIVSIVGRYYAMDRDKRWQRIQQAYDLLVSGKSSYHAQTPKEALELAYARGENDEFVKPTTIDAANTQSISTVNDGDIIIFMNFRADRAREITQSLIDPAFEGFVRKKWPKLGAFISLTEYDQRFATAVSVAFPSQPIHHILAECVSDAGLRQLRIAETEKYAHITFFFNGGIEEPYPREDRVLIPSPKVATYDLQPEMSAREVTERLVQEIKSGRYDFIICNFANADMVGHSGNFNATVKAIETIDECLGKILTALREIGGEALITADHGNAEQMFDSVTNQPHTAHTSDPVPFVYVGRQANIMKKDGILSDVAPTVLYLLNLPKPSEMTGQSLIKFT